MGGVSDLPLLIIREYDLNPKKRFYRDHYYLSCLQVGMFVLIESLILRMSNCRCGGVLRANAAETINRCCVRSSIVCDLSKNSFI